MSRVHKRSYSPTLDDIRQYNIKRVRLLHDLGSFSLDDSSNSNTTVTTTTSTSDTYHEYIPDIEEFLLQNQDDDDIIQSSKHITDLQTVDPDHIVIPAKVVNRPISTSETKSILDILISKKRILREYHGVESAITNDDVINELEIKHNWSLVPYEDPNVTVFKSWEKWYFNVFRLQEFDSAMDADSVMYDDDIEPPDIPMPKVRNTYGGYYNNVSSEASFDDSRMDID